MTDEQVDVTVALHDALSVPAQRAENAVDDLGDEVNQLNAEMTAADASAGRLARSLAALRRAASGLRGDVDSSSRATRALGANARGAGNDSDGLSKKLTKAGDAGKYLHKVIGMFKWSAVATGITLAATAVSSLGAASFAAVAGVSPLVANLAAIPALLGTVLTIFGAVKLGISGIGDALKAVTDQTKTIDEQAKALAALSPAAQSFVLTLAEMKKRTDGWRDSIQAAMFPDFEASLRRTGRLFPVIEDGLARTGGAVGRLAWSLSGVLASSGDELETIFDRNTRLIDNGLNPALVSAFRIFRDFMVAGGPLAERFANWVGVSADGVADLVARGKRTGDLEAFLGRAGDLAATLGRIIANVSVALFNTGKEADALSEAMGGGIEDLTARWRAWTETVEGRNAIRQWFTDAIPVMHELARMTQILAQGFGDLATNQGLAELLAKINDQLLPAILNFANGAAAELGPALVAAGSAFIKFESLLSYSPMAELLFGIASAADKVLDVVSMLPGPIKFLIASLIALKLVVSGLQILTPKLTTAMSPLRTAFGEARAGAQLYSEGLRGIPAATGAARGAMVGLRSAAGGLMGALGGPWGIAITAATVGLGYFMNKQQESKAAVDELKASLDQQTGAITENTRQLIAKRLEEQGALESAQKLGIETSTLVDAITGNNEAYKEQYTRLMALTDSQKKAQVLLGDNKGKMNEQQAAAFELNRILGNLADDTDAATESQKRIAAAADDAGSAASGATGDVSALTQEYERQAAAVGRTRRAILALNETLVGEQRTLIAFRQQVADATDKLTKNAKTLNIHTQAGRDNRLALLDVAEAASKVENKAQRTRAIREATAFIAEWADKAGMGKREADRYADSLFKLADAAKNIPPNARIDVSLYGATEALRQLGQLAAATRRANIGAELGVSGAPARRDGGAVWTGQEFTVGEVGPELYLGASGRLEVIGRAGQEQRFFPEPGVVLPADHPATQVMTAEPVSASVTVTTPPPPGGGDEPPPPPDYGPPPPPIVIQMPPSGHQLTEADVEAAALRAYQAFERQRKERR